MAIVPARVTDPNDVAIEPPPAPPGEDVYDAAKVQTHLIFWQKPWVQQLLPLITSICVHAAIIGVGLYVISRIPEIIRPQYQEQIIIPDATIVEGAQAGGIPNPGLGDDPMRKATQDKLDVPSSSEGWADKTSQTLAETMISGGEGAAAADISVIGLGANTGAGRGSGTGTGKGLAPGAAEGGGIPAPFGAGGGGGGVGPKFMGIGAGGNVRTIVFICDASGSMMNKRLALNNELKKAIDKLRPIQGFNVIFFSRESKADALSSQQLLMATPDNKRKAYTYIDSTSFSGTSYVIPGLEIAFRQKPQLIYLLTDGDFENETNDAVLKKVRELAKVTPIKINTIAFVGNADKDSAFIDTLTSIAKDSGGVFRKVSEDEIP
jgi:hypothetical protein